MAREILTVEEREAKNAYQRAWYARNKEVEVARNTYSRTIRRRDYTQRVAKLKESMPCVDCGLFYPACAMDFDHVRGEKSFGIAVGIEGGRAWPTILAEIEKCELVCANCHRIRTFVRGHDEK